MAEASSVKVTIPVTRMIAIAAHVYFPVCMSKWTIPQARATPNRPELIFPCEAWIKESRSSSASNWTPSSTRETRPSGVQI